MPILKADYSNLDHEEMAVSIGLKAKHIPLLIGSFLQESVSMLDALKESINAKNYEQIKSNAHAIKGSAGNLRFDEIYEMAKDIEFAGNDSKIDFDYDGYFEAIKTAIGTISN
ncbi:MAG: Hpt domain-containing protein [Sulfurimonas sp.]|uniref:Hpt domain-containing protein n=1 Tax=Sulfurimonas sp. TaxID=2022749 RepID=UPI002601E0EF|nr:Hpt domain-containing protein [Sulfurimonas sp.]MCW8896039.1 Hpt domain-containing protein [Sulfurimonas sp.]MCW8954650.1 Hpt domain-containing protein [Sulfurimonas sp.]MCW9067458.1 Hpt domain-containing protein [Sulfurimonas sp.]